MGIDDAIRLQGLRDLLGLVRALFLAWSAERRGPVELQELVDIGRELSVALELATKSGPETMGHRSALNRAERCMSRLGALVGDDVPLRPVLDAAASRVIYKRHYVPVNRDEKREQRRRRG